MNHFEYRNGEMFAEQVPLKRIAQEVGTPAYVYSLADAQASVQGLRSGLRQGAAYRLLFRQGQLESGAVARLRQRRQRL